MSPSTVIEIVVFKEKFFYFSCNIVSTRQHWIALYSKLKIKILYKPQS